MNLQNDPRSRKRIKDSSAVHAMATVWVHGIIPTIGGHFTRYDRMPAIQYFDGELLLFAGGPYYDSCERLEVLSRKPVAPDYSFTEHQPIPSAFENEVFKLTGESNAPEPLPTITYEKHVLMVLRDGGWCIEEYQLNVFIRPEYAAKLKSAFPDGSEV